MEIKLSIPSRINILGNPGDANEGDFSTISMAINLYARAVLKPAEKIILESYSNCNSTIGNSAPTKRLVTNYQKLPLPYDGKLDLVKGGINYLYQYSPEFRKKVSQEGFHIMTWSEVPKQSGLGGSSLFVLLTLAGLRSFYALDQHKLNNYILAEMTQRIEALELGITCGFADRYVPLFGGLAYIDYRGKLYQQEIKTEPYVTYERLDSYIEQIPLIAISTGLKHDSGDVHGPMRSRYLEEHDQQINNLIENSPMVGFMTGTWETAWRGKIALLERDFKSFGELMNKNHKLVDEMMTYCGFINGAGWANNLMIKVALDSGALGAKLTGAGRGGSVFALVHPDDEVKIAAEWGSAAIENGLNEAHIFSPRIDNVGLTVESLY
jgi:galactokinase/mevalonate kinase-like predicted kinase